MGLERVNKSDMRFVLRVGTQCQHCMYFHCSDATDGERDYPLSVGTLLSYMCYFFTLSDIQSRFVDRVLLFLKGVQWLMVLQ